jgi:Flp pilus assembly protein TadG
MAWETARTRLAALAADRAGGIATTFAIVAPVIAMLSCGAIDLFAVHASRVALQDSADAAALAAARQSGMTDQAGIQTRANTFVRRQSASAAKGLTYAVDTSVNEEDSTVTVHIEGVRDSFFGNLLPPGGWKLNVTSVATRVSQVPLCVLSTGEGGGHLIAMKDDAQVTAPKCLVHSNSEIDVSSSGWLNTAIAQSVGEARGRISPEPQTGAPLIEDPFASMNLATTKPCPLLGGVTDLLTNLQLGLPIAPGVHCGSIVVQQNMTMRLSPGEHFFKQGKLEIKKGAKLIGDDVVLIFDASTNFKFTETSEISLKGRRTGDYAGFVIATTTANHGQFEISTSAARELLGTIYIPSARLKVSGTDNKVSDQADWTVIVADSIEMYGSPNLVLNTNYQGSPVPVPQGVGPVGRVRLT